MMWLLTISSLMMSWLFGSVHGHGRLLDPPSRSSMWRQGYSTPANYQDNELYCGGVQIQYEVNGGKCGVCGDPWNGPRENEAGGKYATGIIVRNYDVGQTIDVKVELTANHKGYFEFNLCPTDNPLGKVSEDCLKKYPLTIVPTGATKFPVTSEMGSTKLDIKLRLPDGVTCKACLFRWKYNAGNSWGTNPDGSGCVGCGNQEQFYGCADVAIEGDGDYQRFVNGTGSTVHFFGHSNFYSIGFFVVMNAFVVVLLGVINRP